MLNVIDPEADAALVRARFPEIPESCVCFLKLAGLLLQYGCRAGLSIFDIASVIVRSDCLDADENSEGARSELERLYHRAEKLASSSAGTSPLASPCDGSSSPQTKACEVPSTLAERTPVVASRTNRVGSDSEEERGFWVEDMATATKREQNSRTTPVDWHLSGSDSAEPPQESPFDAGCRKDGLSVEATPCTSTFSTRFWRIADRLLQDVVRAVVASKEVTGNQETT